MTAPTMAEVLAEHYADDVTRDCLPTDDGRMAWVYARRCDCGWHGPSDQHNAHLAQALTAAGYGHVATVEAQVAAAYALADQWEHAGGLDTPRAHAAQLRAALRDDQ